MTWHLRRDGRELTVVEDRATRRRTVLEVDGEPVTGTTTDYWGSSVLEHDDLRVEVEWGPRNRLDRVRLLREDDDALDFVPPPGSSAARRETLRRDHPVRFTVQRVAGAGAGVLVGLLGINVVLGNLLPRIDWSWLPDVDLPDVPDAPAWLRYVDPFHWLARIPWPDVSLPDLVPDWLADSAPFWLPLVVAAAVALGEVDRRRKQDAARSARDAPGSDDDEDDPSEDPHAPDDPHD